MAVERALCRDLVGREKELSELEDALLAARRGEGRVVLLAGDAGMGKTRLATELAGRARAVGMDVLWGGCSEADLALPYLPFLEAIGNYLAVADMASVRERLGPIRGELAHLFPQLEPEGTPPDVDSAQGKLRLYEAVLALLGLPANDRGLLLVVEDLHWADASTRELLDYLTRRLRDARILILATYRRDEMHRRHPLLPLIQRWRRNATTTNVELDPLAEPEIADMVRAIFDIRDVRSDTSAFLLDRTEGNPFVLEEMLKVAIDRGDIFRTDTGWDRKALSDIRIPDTVRDTILVRLDRLSETQVEVLRSGAVLGASFSFEDLVAVSQLTEAAVQEAVEASILHQLVELDPNAPRAYRFRHALTREAIYEDMIVPHRERLHGRAADHLSAQRGRAIDVTHHLLAAGRGAEASPLCLEAAAEAETAYAFLDAAQLYRRALPFVGPGVPHARVLCRLGTSLHWASQPGEALQYLEEGIGELEARGEKLSAAGFRLTLGRSYWEAARSPDALKAYEQARAVLEEAGPSPELAMAYVRLAGMRLFQFDVGGGLAYARKGVEVAQECGADAQRIWAQSYMGLAISHEDAERGIVLLDSSFEQARAVGLYSIAANALWNGVVCRMGSGRVQEIAARADLMAALPIAPTAEMQSLMIGAFSAGLQGQPERSLALNLRALEIAEETGGKVWELRIKNVTSLQLVELDRLEEASSLLPPAEFAEAQEQLGRMIIAVKLALARGDSASAASEAAAVFSSERWAPSARNDAVLNAVQGFLAAGDVGAARRAAAMSTATDQFGLHHIHQQTLARIALAEGRAADAESALAGVSEELRERGYIAAARHAELLQADVLIALGRTPDAVRLLRSLASESGAPLVNRLARERLAELGEEIPLAPASTAAAERAQPAGERFVTVLFADVRGYTKIAGSVAPSDLVDRIAALHRWAKQEIERGHGVVDKFAGDAVMATFNVSGSSLDHAVQALRSGLALRDKAASQNLPLGIGIATGAAVVGSLTSGANMSVIGSTTNLASRLEGSAEPGEILIDEEARRRVASWCQEHGLDLQPVSLDLKGFDRSVTAFRIATALPV